jgi:ABC-2 type transport system permease protein
MSLLWAFLLKDIRVAWSYRFSFMVQCLSLMFSLTSIRFLSDLVEDGTAEKLSAYGGDYFSFALIGIALSMISFPVVKSFAAGVRSAQTTGTLEAMLTMNCSSAMVVIGVGIFPVLQACLQVVLILLAAAVALGADLHVINIAPAALVLLMTIAALMGIGLASAAFVLAFKQNEPFSGALLAMSFLISGVLYPTSVLPNWLAPLAPLLPTTHALDLSRGLLVGDVPVNEMLGHLAALAGFCLTLPIGLVLLAAALRHAKRNGSISHY